ncbi:MAG: glycoside hydrolase family 31 protein [candidate division KSB1 bacterium]|nr:glycoside hydrolase family 31 protein [candidate division KSB1 bacterium]
MSKSLLFAVLFLALIAIQAASSGFQFIGGVTSFEQNKNIIVIQCHNALVRVTVLSDDLFRIEVAAHGSFRVDNSYSVLPIKTVPSQLAVADLSDEIQISTNELRLIIKKFPCRLAFYDVHGNLICKDHDAFGTGWNGSKICCWKELHDESFYGLGEKTRGLNKRGHVYTMWNSDIPGYTPTQDPLYQSHPFLMGLYQGRGFGIYFDNSYRSQFNLGAGTDQFFSFSADDGPMDYYFIYGPSLKKVLARYGQLVGTLPLPPKWSLGYQQCRWSYYPESEVLALARTFRSKQIPCDVIYLDIHYMDGYRIFTWDKTRFPQPKRMIQDLRNMGFKIAVIIDPGIKVDPNYWVYQDGIKGDHFCKYPDGTYYQGQVWPGWCHFPDFSKPATRDWFCELYRDLVEDGVVGFWNDMNEPATWGGTFPDIVQFDDEGRKADHLKIHNLYGMLMAKSSYEGIKKLRPNDRPFVLTRAGFSGVQRYSAVWTGDNVASWEHLKMSIAMCLGLGMTGVAFCGMDIGGFMNAPTSELYTRWIQLGTFTPLFRTHTCIDTPDQEPWSFGDSYEEINKKYIQLRYQLLPYLYHTFYQSATQNAPIMRPMIYEFQEDPMTYWMDDQFMLGDKLLIAPVYQANQIVRKVYFPKGEWYNFWTDEKIIGPTEKLVEAPLDQIPMFVKSGSILPMQPTMQYVGELPPDPLVVEIYPSPGISNDSLYEDDGNSFDYQKGQYRITQFELSVQQKKINLLIERIVDGYSPEKRSFLLKFHASDLKPHRVNIDKRSLQETVSLDELHQEKLGWTYHSTKKLLYVKFPDSWSKANLEVRF